MARPLGDSVVLVADCQSTGATPARGRLLELGWTTACAAAVRLDQLPKVAARLVQLPDGESIPRAVSRVTGIQQADLVQAASPRQAWVELAAAAAAVAQEAGVTQAPTVIHYARFEEPFLRRLHDDHGEGPFPFDIVCTHQVARRVLASLPRRGLRAVAGYFGYPVEPLRRSTGHVAASAFIWAKLVPLLADEGVESWGDLALWLAETTPGPGRCRVYPMDRDRRLAVSPGPGVYRFLRTGGDLLYIGKATSLRRRVNSYFQKQRGLGERMLEMLSQARDLSVTVTETALEAALLEADEIKHHQPPYNIALRQADRAVWFARLDGTAALRQVDGRHPIGPLPAPDCLRPLAALVDLLGATGSVVSPAQIRAALGMPSGATSELTTACFVAGLATFAAEHRRRLVGPVSVAGLLALGAELWRRRCAAGTAAEPSAPNDDETSPTNGPRAWDPERVAKALEHGVLAAGQVVRRARWLRWLCEATVGWHEPGRAEGELRLLAIEGGVVATRGYLSSAADLPIPAGAKRSLRERQRCFDLATYDRLRTLSTELRRILSVPGARGAVRLGAGHPVQGWALRRVLQWA